MSNPKKAEVIRRFREQVKADNLDKVRVTYRISGGIPAEGRLDEEFHLSGREVEVYARDMSIPGAPVEVNITLDRSQLKNMLKELGQDLDSLATREEACFLPDSLIGSITIEVDGEEETLFFVADEEQRKEQNKSLSPRLTKTIREFSQWARRLLPKKGESPWR